MKLCIRAARIRIRNRIRIRRARTFFGPQRLKFWATAAAGPGRRFRKPAALSIRPGAGRQRGGQRGGQQRRVLRQKLHPEHLEEVVDRVQRATWRAARPAQGEGPLGHAVGRLRAGDEALPPQPRGLRRVQAERGGCVPPDRDLRSRCARSVLLGSCGNTMRNAVRNKEWWRRRRMPTQDPSTDLRPGRRPELGGAGLLQSERAYAFVKRRGEQRWSVPQKQFEHTPAAASVPPTTV